MAYLNKIESTITGIFFAIWLFSSRVCPSCWSACLLIGCKWEGGVCSRLASFLTSCWQRSTSVTVRYVLSILLLHWRSRQNLKQAPAFALGIILYVRHTCIIQSRFFTSEPDIKVNQAWTRKNLDRKRLLENRQWRHRWHVCWVLVSEAVRCVHSKNATKTKWSTWPNMASGYLSSVVCDHGKYDLLARVQIWRSLKPGCR